MMGKLFIKHIFLLNVSRSKKLMICIKKSKIYIFLSQILSKQLFFLHNFNFHLDFNANDLKNARQNVKPC